MVLELLNFTNYNNGVNIKFKTIWEENRRMALSLLFQKHMNLWNVRLGQERPFANKAHQILFPTKHIIFTIYLKPQCGLCLKYCAIFVTHTLVPSFSQNMYPILHICTNSSWKAKPIKGIEIGTYVHGSKQERIVAKFLLDLYNRIS